MRIEEFTTPEEMEHPLWLDELATRTLNDQLPRKKGEGCSLFDAHPYHIVRGLNRAIAESDDISDGLITNMLLMNRYNDFGVVAYELVNELSREERHEVFTLFANLSGQVPKVGSLFPEELSKPVAEAYGESVTSLLYALEFLKQREMPADKLAEVRAKSIRQENDLSGTSTLTLLNGSHISLDEYTFDEALSTIKSYTTAVDRIVSVVHGPDETTVPMVDNGNLQIIRLGKRGQALAIIRNYASPTYDPTIEFPTPSGTEATINYTVEEDGGEVSHYKSEHRSPLSIRVDNEGNRLSLDIGAIMDAPHTLNKRIADLISIGDLLRSTYIDKDVWLNHHKNYFAEDMAHPETFVEMVSKTKAYFNRKSASKRMRRLALKQTIAS